MKKTVIECKNCKKKCKTDQPQIVIRFCKGCNQETEFELVKKKQPVIQKGKVFDFMCLRCRTVRHGPVIPKSCGCGQRFQQHAENTTLTDVLYNMIVGSDDKQKGYMKVSVGRDGQVWWTPLKDEFGDDVDPLIGDSEKLNSSSYQGQGDISRDRDDLRPVYRQTTTTQRKKDFRS